MTVVDDIARATPGYVAGIGFLRRPGRSSGLPLVLLHGIGSNAKSFTGLMAALPPTLDVIAWNAPGYATSQPLAAAAPTPRDYALALERLLEALGYTRIMLAGHSLGCLFAASFATLAPARVAALALFSPALGYKVRPGAELPPAVQARIDEIESLGPEAFAAKRAARLVHEPAAKPRVLNAVREAMAAVNPAGYAQAVRALGAGDLLADAARIATPTLVAVGAEDAITPPANARATYEALPNGAGYHEVPDAGHAVSQENPAAVAGLMTELIEANHG
jgi:pimeloyl-ACP methyl ester carboxylesterase